MNKLEIQVEGKAAGAINSLESVGKKEDQLGQRARAAAQMADEALGRMGRSAGQAGDRVGRAARDADESLERVRKQAKKTGEELEDLGQQGEGIGDGLRAGADEGGDAAEGLLGKMGPLGAGISKLGPIGMAAGATIAAGFGVALVGLGKLKEALDASTRRNKAAALAGAQGLGVDPERLKEIGKLAGSIYGDNFAASIEDATTAVRDVWRAGLLPEDAGEDDIRFVTEKIITLADIAEDETGRVSNAIGQMLKTGMAKNAHEAMDIVTRGFQEGVDKSGDFLDTLNEYGTQFRKFGMDGAQATGLLVQGIRAGARDADIVADAIKEFSIRAIDGSELTKKAFKDLGLNAKQMATDIAAGGPKANAALDTTLDRLRAVKDPVKQAELAVALFGTQAEDLGKALFALDPSQAVKRLGEVEGATFAAGEAMASAVPWTETLGRKWEELKANIGDKLQPVMEKLGKKFNEYSEKIMPKLKEALQFIKDELKENEEGIEKFKQLLEDSEPVIMFISEILIGSLAGSIGFVIESLGFMGEAWETAKEVMTGVTLGMLDQISMLLQGGARMQRAFGPLWMGPNLIEASRDFDAFAAGVRADLASIPDQKVITVRFRMTGLNELQDAIADVLNIRRPQSGLAERRAAGGPAGGLTWVGDGGGPELVRLPHGSMVHSAATSSMMTAQSNSSAGSTQITIGSDGGRLGDALVELIATSVRRGGGRPELLGIRG